MEFTATVIDHFVNPRNMGEIKDPSYVAQAEDNTCGDKLSLYVKIEGDRITDAKFKALGCGAFVATSSMVTEMIKGKTLDEAKQLTSADIIDALGGLPEEKSHCAALLKEVVDKVVVDYGGKNHG